MTLHLLDSGYSLLQQTDFGGLWRDPESTRTMSFEWAVKHCLAAEQTASAVSETWIADVEAFLRGEDD